MESSTRTRKSNHKATAALLAVLSGLFSIMMLTASPAGAVTPIHFPVPSPEIAIPVDPLFPVAKPYGRVVVSCTSETATANLNNPTSSFYFGISIKVNGIVVGGGTVGPNQVLAEVFDLDEDETKRVVIKDGTKTYFDDNVKRDCSPPPLVVVDELPKGRVDVSCTSETATAKFNNPTSNFLFGILIKVDGVTVETGTVGPNQAMVEVFDLAENGTKRVVIRDGAKIYFDDDVTRDCRLPDASYQVLQSCVTGLAHARLINNGDDTAYMAVDYPGDANALQAVGANSSTDWLLEIAPDETKDFTVRDSFGTLGNETLAFDCAPEGPTSHEGPVAPPEGPTSHEGPVAPPEGPTSHEGPVAPPKGPKIIDPTPIPETGTDADLSKQVSGPPVPTVPAGPDSGFGGTASGESTGFNGTEGESTDTDGLAIVDIGSDGDEIIETAVAGKSLSAGETSQGGSSTKIYLAILWGVVLLVGAVLVFITMRRRSAVAFS